MEDCFKKIFADNLSRAYDYIVIGGGTAGCVVASRLSQHPKVTVLLLEAGGWDDKSEIHIPAEANSLRQSELDWNYLTVPQRHACRAKCGERDEWALGKVIGGCSSINNMHYGRGHESDYNLWAASGADGWSWEEVLPFFLLSERNTSEELGTSKFHNTGGLLTVSDGSVTTEAGKAFFEAAKELGYEQCDLTSGTNCVGIDVPQATIAYGKRCNTATEYLKLALERQNLVVVTNALVMEIVICGGEAIGVRVAIGEKERKVRVRQEVVLSAGAIGSPKLLMLSGIGPSSHLERVNIECKCDLPVGQNLQDQIAIAVKATIPEGSGGCITIKEKESLATYLEYVIQGTGILASNGIEGTLLLKPDVDKIDECPDVQLNFIPTFYHLGNDEPALSRLKSLSFEKMLDHHIWEALRVKKEGVTFHLILLHPRSKGNLTLQSGDAKDPPNIDPRYLEEEHDLAVLKAGVCEVKRLLETTKMREAKIEMIDIKMQKDSELAFSGENLDSYIRCFAGRGSNPVGTCKMGTNNDNSAVVDPQLRVRGIRGLRVIDASIMPTLPSVNSIAPTIMIAEKGVAYITKDHDAIVRYYKQNPTGDTTIPHPYSVERTLIDNTKGTVVYDASSQRVSIQM